MHNKVYNSIIYTSGKLAQGGIRMTAYGEAEFWDYIITDERGYMIGVREDMPDSAWPDYEAFLEEQRKAKELGIKV